MSDTKYLNGLEVHTFNGTCYVKCLDVINHMKEIKECLKKQQQEKLVKEQADFQKDAEDIEFSLLCKSRNEEQ